MDKNKKSRFLLTELKFGAREGKKETENSKGSVKKYNQMMKDRLGNWFGDSGKV